MFTPWRAVSVTPRWRVKEAFGENVLGQTQTYECFKCLNKERQFQSNVKSRVDLFFLTPKASCIRNLFYQDRLCKENSIVMFWGEWEKTSSSNIQTSGKTPTGPCIITTFWLTFLVVQQFLASTNMTVITHPPYSDLIPCDFSHSRRWNWSSRGNVLTALKRCRPKSRAWLWHWHQMTSNRVSIMEIPLILLCQCRMGLLHRGWRRIKVLISSQAAAEEFRELLGSTSYDTNQYAYTT